jgi:hypothetical protein
MNKSQATDPTYINKEDASHESFENDEINLSQLFFTIWSGRGLIAGISLALFLLVGIYFGTKFLGFAGQSSHDIQLRFTFNGSEKGIYPNKTKFQLSDIISNQTLNIVYKKYKLADSGLSQADFISHISIRPAAINREFIDAKYKTRLGSKGLSQTEIEKLEKAYKSELDTASYRSAILSYADYSKSTIPNQLIEKFLFAIPTTWSTLAINEHGVLDLPVISASAMNLAELKDEEFIIGTALIRDNIKLLASSLLALEKNERIALVREPKSGLTIKDLSNQLQTFKSYRLEPLASLITTKQAYKDLATVKIFLQSKLQSNEDTLNNTLQKAAIYKAAYDEHALLSKNMDAKLQAPTSTKTEIGDSFFGQLLKLGDEASESKYRQELTAKQINLKLQAEDIKAEIIIIKRQLAGLKNKSQQKTENTPIADTYLKTINSFEKLTRNYSLLLELSRKHALSNNGSLFNILNSSANITRFDKIQLKRVITMAIVALIVGGMIGVFITLVLRSRK